jgi:hypothetical protein
MPRKRPAIPRKGKAENFAFPPSNAGSSQGLARPVAVGVVISLRHGWDTLFVYTQRYPYPTEVRPTLG